MVFYRAEPGAYAVQRLAPFGCVNRFTDEAALLKLRLWLTTNTHPTNLELMFEELLPPNMKIEYRRISPQEFSLLAPDLVSIYLDAMDYPRTMRNSRVNAWRRDIFHPGFTAVIAVVGDTIIGFAYGFLGYRGYWWDNHLRAFLEQAGSTSEHRAKLASYVELAELHVLPQLQGHGVGKQLLLQLAWNLPAKYLLLSTPEVPDEANRAFGLYRSLGFQDLARHVHYPGDQRAYAILAAPLPLEASTNQ